MKRRNVGIFVFEDVEVLDFAGPYEVFSRTRLEPGVESRRSETSAPFRVFTVARERAPLSATGGLRLLPDHGFGDAPPIDVLVVPGGFGTRPLLEDDAVREWILAVAERAERVASVCTGALLLARAGLLDGRRATTHWAALDMLRAAGPQVEVVDGVRWVEDGLLTSAGVAAGIDMSLGLVEALHGRDVADETARYIDYPRRAREASSG